MTDPWGRHDDSIHCGNCNAACCRQEVLLVSDTGVPEEFIATDRWGSMSMRRLEDGWCSALDRSSYRCSIYEHRPWICREFQMGQAECIAARAEIGVNGSN